MTRNKCPAISTDERDIILAALRASTSRSTSRPQAISLKTFSPSLPMATPTSQSIWKRSITFCERINV